ncbi:MAG: UDP-3-O-[3-hydroxymyristoyl] N-acetylglucosamine deacetylase [Holophagales bacterium]|jgi:UDP-3-O-[3-hydroxymyristoyl] N-acetylglucosamine deacetylase|nr:UDP-3-O-[3-hydroxymyristoyl] N-acetylglucosamine deacetylase [Holophagales bacterium]
MRLQTTLGRTISVSGVGLHSGRQVCATLRPAPAGRGIAFVRTDVGVVIPAIAEEAGRLDFATSLGQPGREVGTIEHLLSAAVGLGLDNLTVEIDGPEVPILDGSSAPWVAEFREAGLVPLGSAVRPFAVTSTLSVHNDDGKWIEIRPAKELRVSYSIDFPNPAIGRQSISLVLTPDIYADHLAPARTFGFLAEYDYLRSKGLARGASEENCIVVGDADVVNGSLRFADEFVRHKALDLIGDLALVGRPVVGHVVAHRAGHALHTALAKKIRQAAASEHVRRSETVHPSLALAGR